MMKLNKIFISKIKTFLKYLALGTRNSEDLFKHYKDANVEDVINIMTVVRFCFFDPLFRVITFLSRIRYESLFFFVFKGKIKKKHIVFFSFKNNYKKLFYRRIRKRTCLNTVSFRLNFFKSKQYVKISENKIFAVLLTISCILFMAIVFFAIKNINNRKYFINLYEELFSKGFWKSSIFKIFLFKGQNYIEDFMQYEGNTVFSFVKVICRKFIQLYNTILIITSLHQNKKIKKTLEN